MLIYEKISDEVRHLFGTVANIPADSDNQLVYQDADGDSVTPSLSYQYFDDGHGGIKMVDSEGTETFLAVNIKKADNSLVNVIPGGSYEPAAKVLESIRFSRKPTKTEYAADATEVDPAGAKIEATWKTGEKSIVALTDEDLSFAFKAELVAGVDNAIVATYVYPHTGTQVTKTAEYQPITVVAAPAQNEQQPEG